MPGKKRNDRYERLKSHTLTTISMPREVHEIIKNYAEENNFSSLSAALQHEFSSEELRDDSFGLWGRNKRQNWNEAKKEPGVPSNGDIIDENLKITPSNITTVSVVPEVAATIRCYARRHGFESTWKGMLHKFATKKADEQQFGLWGQKTAKQPRGAGNE